MLLIGWTTVADRPTAERLAHGLIDAGLAVCVQIDGPITSVYRWQNKVETATEFRLCVKLLPAKADAIESWLNANHPYAIAEWVVVRAEIVAEKYLSWALTSFSNPPL